ncbi:MAG: carbon-nitrogen hydrolase family protein [Candidatus Hydrogenedentes bacterium]|nr:carbon-nitrogen hydrolase family protein [Candidatus Hydrogenedentota bacterium]
MLYYVSKWQNYCTRDASVDLFEKQFAALRPLLDRNADVRVITDENLLHEDLRAGTVVIPYAEVMDGPVRERLRAVSMGARVVALSKPGIYTPIAKTGGNFGARIERVKPGEWQDALRAPHDRSRVLRVAAVQFHTAFDVESNTARIVEWIDKAADAGARVAVFSEMALTGYTKKAEFREALDWHALDAAIEAVASACKRRGIYAIVGAPTRDGGDIFCAAIAFDPAGNIIDRYEKTYLAGEAWATPGRRLTTFGIDGATCATIICHDERYPHLVQLRALAGAQLFFYISCESGLDEEHKIGPYRAQLQARAVENGVYIVHANAPAVHGDHGADGTSNGHSRIIGPDGNLVDEAGAYDDAMVIADIDLRIANDAGRPAALENGPTARWLRKGTRLVR